MQTEEEKEEAEHARMESTASQADVALKEMTISATGETHQLARDKALEKQEQLYELSARDKALEKQEQLYELSHPLTVLAFTYVRI